MDDRQYTAGRETGTKDANLAKEGKETPVIAATYSAALNARDRDQWSAGYADAFTAIMGE